jgi:hypothetical protein
MIRISHLKTDEIEEQKLENNMLFQVSYSYFRISCQMVIHINHLEIVSELRKLQHKRMKYNLNEDNQGKII